MRWQKLNPGLVPAGSTLQLSSAIHGGKTVLFDTLTGSVVTLPPARGSGMNFRFLISVVATSNSHIVKVQNAVDIVIGQMVGIGAAASDLVGYAANGTTDDTITLNRSTTGGTSKGEYIEVDDIAVGIWAVNG